MFLDWLTLRLTMDHAPTWAHWSDARALGDRIVRYNAATGEEVWSTTAWDSIRSDSHQVAARVTIHPVLGTAFWIQGSPARVVGDGDAVFGEALGLDLCRAARAMIDFTFRQLGWDERPDLMQWLVSRVDVTENYDVGSLPNVRIALRELRGCEGARYRVSQTAGDTVYWSHHSRLRSGKAYAKGPHLAYLAKKDDYSAIRYSFVEIQRANRLLRCELKLGSQWWREEAGLPWYEITEDRLRREHESYFERMVGTEIDMANVDFVERLENVAPTRGQGRSAARTWAVIQSAGWEAARSSMPPRTWYRHLGILRDAGLGDADISAGRVVSLRRTVVMRPVTKWADLETRCA